MATPVQKLRRPLSWLAAIAFLIIALFSAVPPPSSFLFKSLKIGGYVLMIAAALGRIWCGIYISGRKDTDLCQEGPYSLCRNPLYLFSFIGMAGVMCALQNIPLLLISVPLYWIYYIGVIRAEEKNLARRFGDKYLAYTSRTGAIIPRFGHFRPGDTVEINPRVMVRAISDAGVFLWLIVLIEIRELAAVLYPGGSIGHGIINLAVRLVGP